MIDCNVLFEGAPNIPIAGLYQDSREVMANGMFFCVKGMHVDGHHFVEAAIGLGATCVVHSDPLVQVAGIVYVQVNDVVYEMNRVADLFYDQPSKKLQVIGVTGTNGKSTISYVTYQLLNRLQNPTGYIGTISIAYGDKELPSPYTTPETIFLHRTLHDMVEAGMQSVSMEVSSNGLFLQRTSSVAFDVGIFTNLTHEHLDFHGTMENYLAAKKLLFSSLRPEATAILNKDDGYYEDVLAACQCKVLTYSLYQDSDLMAKHVKMNPKETSFTLVHQGQEYFVHTNLLAMFNVSNLLAAIAAVHTLGYSMEDILVHVNDLDQVAGRIAFIDHGQPFQVIVDYAHTPDGFTKIYEYAKNITPKTSKIITVFGSAGQRDAKKRAILGKISDAFCDMIVLTEEDPRTEKAKQIAEEIKLGIASKRQVFIESREAAIHQAIALADEGDTVLILGKGDEDFLDRAWGREAYPGDHVVAKEALEELHAGGLE